MTGNALGLRSPLVLSKIGFDMRSLYESVLTEPLPPTLKALTDELQGYVAWRDVAPNVAMGADAEAAIEAGQVRNPATDLMTQDAPFCF